MIVEIRHLHGWAGKRGPVKAVRPGEVLVEVQGEPDERRRPVTWRVWVPEGCTRAVEGETRER